MAINLSGKKEKTQVWLFGLICFICEVIIANLPNPSLLLLFVINMTGGLFVQTFFWNRYLGKDVYFKRKSPFIPLLIAFAILFVCILLNWSDIKPAFEDGLDGPI